MIDKETAAMVDDLFAAWLREDIQWPAVKAAILVKVPGLTVPMAAQLDQQLEAILLGIDTGDLDMAGAKIALGKIASLAATQH